MDKIQKRYINYPTSTFFIISSMIGTGIFTSLGFQLKDITSVFSLLLLWVIGGIISFCGAVTYAEISSSMPRSGGEYHILSELIHPSIGFVSGLISATVGFSAPAVLAAIALSNYAATIFHSINISYFTIFIITSIHILHGFKIELGIRFQDIFTIIKLLLIIVFIFFGLKIPNPQQITLIPNLGDFKILFSSSFAVSLMWVTYAYAGWNSIIYIAGEVQNPIKNIPKSIFTGTFIVMMVYVLLSFTFLYSTPMSNMVNKIEIGAIAGESIFGSQYSYVFTFGIMILLLSTISSYVFMGPRVIQVIGEDYKFLNIFSIKNKNKIPQNAFLFQYLLSLCFILTSTFEQVLIYTSISLTIISTVAVFSIFIYRFKKIKHLNNNYLAWGYPVTPIVFIFLNCWILFYNFFEKPFESYVGVGIILFGFLVYLINKKN